jgi:hypothetical protein
MQDTDEAARGDRTAKLRQALASLWTRGFAWLLTIYTGFSLYRWMTTGRIHIPYVAELHTFSDAPFQVVLAVAGDVLWLLAVTPLLLWVTFSKPRQH